MRIAVCLAFILALAACAPRPISPPAAPAVPSERLRNVGDPETLLFLAAERRYAEKSLEALLPRTRRFMTRLGELGTESEREEILTSSGVWALEPVPGSPLPRLVRVSAGEAAMFDPNGANIDPAGAGLHAIRVDPLGRRAAFLLSSGASPPRAIYVAGEESPLQIEARGDVEALEWAVGGNELWYVERLHGAVFNLCKARRFEAPECGRSFSGVERSASLTPSTDRRFILLRLATANQSVTYPFSAESGREHPPISAAGVLSWADHTPDGWLVRTSEDAPDFRIVRHSEDRRTITEVVPETPGKALVRHFALPDGMLVQSRAKARDELDVYDASGQLIHSVRFDDPVYELDVSHVDASEFRVTLGTPLAPARRFRYHARTNELAPEAAPPPAPETEVMTYFAESTGGVLVPLTHIAPRGSDEKRLPTVLFGYGAYGRTSTLRYSPLKRLLIEQGAAVALCEARGGGFLGARWHAAGKAERHGVTASDFAACAAFLVKNGLADRNKVVVWGRSAGGLFAASASRRFPDLFAGAVLEAPLLDPRSAITRVPPEKRPPLEVKEWGDPADPAVSAAMSEYSPAESIELGLGVPTLVAAGLEDTLTGAAEAAPWVAELRRRELAAPLLFYVFDDTTHEGARTAPEARRQEAIMAAFALDALGSGSGG